MRLSSLLIVSLTFLAAAGLSVVVAGFAATVVERNTETAVRRTLDDAGLTWAEVTADGLRVVLAGTAANEADRFTAISVVGGSVDASRIIDEMDVPPSEGLAPPRFSAEILRNDSGISIIGLIPEASNRSEIIEGLAQLAGAERVADLLETARYDAPEGWMDAVAFGVRALQRLPRAKISIEAGQVSITAITDSAIAKEALEQALTRDAPPGLRLALAISAPRPVITPFTLRFHLDSNGGGFDACSAESEQSRDRILAAAKAAGLTHDGDCVIGMGVPSPNWATAAEQSLASVAALGGGTVTIANADITLSALQGTDPGLFDRVVGELETALPRVFSLHAVLPVPEDDAAAGPPEFTATLSPEGQVQLRGRVNDETLRRMADSFAKARFGSTNVYTAARVVEDLPASWPVRVLAGLDALSQLQRGALRITPDDVQLSGLSHSKNAPAELAKLLSAQLGETQTYTLDIAYEAPPEPKDKPLSPERCEAQLASVQAEGKIAFEPGSATIAGSSRATMDAIAAILKRCGEVRLEIQGHTDSQGRESMNQQLSQARAQSVLNELRARRILTSSFAAKGYGEANPIADNGTEAGREENRRIEFHLIRPAAAAEETSTLDEAAGAAPETASEAAPEADTQQETTGQ